MSLRHSGKMDAQEWWLGPIPYYWPLLSACDMIGIQVVWLTIGITSSHGLPEVESLSMYHTTH